MRAPHDTAVLIEAAMGDRVDTLAAGLLRVLVVDHDGVDLPALQHALNRIEAYETDVVPARSVEDTRILLKTRQFDVVFVSQPAGSRADPALVQELGGREADHVLILITRQADASIRNMALMAGTIHSIDRNDFEPRVLETVIRYALFSHRLEQRLYGRLIVHKQAQEQLTQKLLHLAEEIAAKSFNLSVSSNILGQAAFGKPELKAAAHQAVNVGRTAEDLKRTAYHIANCLKQCRNVSMAGTAFAAVDDDEDGWIDWGG